MKKKHAIALLIIILFIGVFLRFYNLGKESLWLDEGATALAIKHHGTIEALNIFYNLGQILPEFYTNNSDLPTGNSDLPSYYFFLSIWAKLFGSSETALRAFSALFGSLSIIFVFLISKDIFNEKIALLSSLIAALNLTLIEYSQEARTYSFLLLFSLLSVYFLVKFLKTKNNLFLFPFVASTLIGVYTHYLFAFFVLFEAAFIYGNDAINLIKRKKLTLGRLSISYFVVILAYLPLINRMINQKLVTIAYFGRPSFASFLQVALGFNTWIYPSESLRQNIKLKNLAAFSVSDSMLVLSIILLAAILTAFALISAFKLLKSKKKENIMILLWLFVPISASLLSSYIHPTITTFGRTSYVMYSIPAYIMVVSNGIFSTKWKYSIFFIVLILFLSILPINAYYANIHKQQFREVALFLKDNSKKQDVIFFNINTGITPFTYYYGQSNSTYPLMNLSRTVELSKGKNSVWLVYTFAKYSDPEGKIKNYFDTNYKLAEKKHFFDIELYRYVK